MQVVHNVQVHPPVRLSHVFLQVKDWWQTHPDLLISLGNEDKIMEGGHMLPPLCHLMVTVQACSIIPGHRSHYNFNPA